MQNKTLEKRSSLLFIGVVIFLILAGIFTTCYQFKTVSIVSEVEESVIIDRDFYFVDSLSKFPADGKYCLTCHEGIEPTRPHSSKMMQQIYALGTKVGDPNGCVVCHGGNPNEITNKNRAHNGAPKGNAQQFYTPVPGSLNVNNNTCGLCHEDHTYNAHRSIMNTDAGKIKSITWGWGIGTENKDHSYGNHAIDDPDGPIPRFGSDIYKGYMREMAELFPGQFPTELKAIPQADLSTLADMPEQAAFTYLRNCNACHLSGKGMQDRGHYRGMGCAACHSLYGNEGFYEGGDKSIPHEKGHLMVHSMQGSRKSPVFVNGKRITGIQNSTCAACHSAGRRIGHTYQGFMPLGSSYNRGPFDEKGNPQQPNASYVFKYMRDDVHHRVSKDGQMIMGLSCQDCHTTTSMHGNGNIGSTTLATIEIECADCHGTPTAYPWELPIGYGDEFGRKVDMSHHRGIATEPEEVTKKFGVVYPKHDGYILTTRGNAYGNVVKDGNNAWLYTERGLKILVPVLKNINNRDSWKHTEKAKTAMVDVPKHLESLECYACHSTWVPQYYEYKYVIDYREKTIDWIASAALDQTDGTTSDYDKNYVMQPGRAVAGDYSHSRWENFPLGINGEGRVTPLTAVIQTVGTVIDTKGVTVAFNRVAKTADGINAIELQPVQPHTASLEARTCTECHGNPQAMGYGLENGAYDSDPAIPRYADAVDLYGDLVSRFTKVQIQGIKDLHSNFMQILSKNGKQLLTVDSHWKLSSPLTPEQREKLDRDGTCIACHQSTSAGAIPIKMLYKIAQVTNMSFADGESHSKLLNQNNVLIAWIKFVGIIFLFLLPFICIVLYIYRAKIVAIFRAIKSIMFK